MKKFFLTFGIIAIAAITVFLMTGCPGDPAGNGNGDSGQPFSVSGKFNSGTGEAQFRAATTANIARSVLGANVFEMSGELEDEDILFRLKGTFDLSKGSYSLSAGSDNLGLRYIINGNAKGATATIAVRDTSGNWTNTVVSVTETDDANIGGGGEPIEEAGGGIPEWAWGNWEDKWSQDDDLNVNSFEAWAYFNQWYYELYASSRSQGRWTFTKTKYTVAEYEEVSDGVYDIIFSYLYYPATNEQQKEAAAKFLKEELGINDAKFWPHEFAPWDAFEDGKVWWYICMDQNHDPGNIVWPEGSFELLESLLAEKNKTLDDFYGEVYENTWIQEEERNDLWIVRNNIEAFFDEHEIDNQYYWGWYHEQWVDEENSDRGYAYLDADCPYWEPAENSETFWETFWDTTHYYLKWGNQIDFFTGKDWEGISRFYTEDYLNNYLESQNVIPETWYTRARLYMHNDTDFTVQYYEGDNETKKDHHPGAPDCNTKSLAAIKALTFNPDYWGHSNGFARERSVHRR